MQSVLFITLVFFVWAVFHSILADYRVKAWFRRRFGDRAYRWYRLGYNIFATLSFIPVFLAYWRLPDSVLWVAPAPLSWLMRGLQFAGLVGLIAAVFETDVGEYAGLAQLRPGWRPDRKEPMRLSGLYCLVRHPIYFFSLPLIWLSPVITVNGLTIAILFTLYFYFGAKHEETGLRAEFGPLYDDYRQRVSMLLPRLRRPSCN
jgi:protein-S-isoprenylcysteine O-methyltransferase Ste14